MDERSFLRLILIPAFEKALDGENPSKPIPIKLALDGEVELVGTMIVEVVKDPN